MLSEEQTTDLLAATTREVDRRIASRGERERGRERLHAKLSAQYPEHQELKRAALFVEPSTPLPSAWPHLVAAFEMRLVGSATLADVIVTRNPWALLDECTNWAAVLHGAWIGVSTLLAPVPTGPCRKLKAAIKTRRQVFVSGGFRVRHCHLWVVLLEVLVAAGRAHQWVLLDSPEAWAAAKAAAVNKGRSAEVLCLVSAAEAGAQLCRARHIFGPSEFIDFIMNSDSTTGALGLGGM